MINGLEGIPGSGKSYEAAVFQVLAALQQGRKVITNLPLRVDSYAAIDPSFRALIEIRHVPAPVRGTWKADRTDLETGQGSAFELFEDGRTEPAPSSAKLFGTVWDYWTDWKHPTSGLGPMFVIDECHVPMPKIGTDPLVIEWYKLHRHFNIDVLLATQQFRQMNADIAGLMAMVIKVRKADVLGKPDEYIRKVHAGYRGAVIQTTIRKYEAHNFALYKSHTQGNSVLESGASDVAPLSVKLKRITRLVWGAAAVCVAFAVFVFSRDSKPHDNAPGFKSPVVKADGKTDYAALAAMSTPPAAAPLSSESAPAVAPSTSAPAPVQDPEPYAGKGLHLTGRMTMGARVIYTFAVSVSGTAITQVTSDDLRKVGYTWEAMTDCAGYLRWHGAAKSVTCDAPKLQSGTDARPLVMNNGYGSDGRVPAGARPSSSSEPVGGVSAM